MSITHSNPQNNQNDKISNQNYSNCTDLGEIPVVKKYDIQIDDLTSKSV